MKFRRSWGILAVLGLTAAACGGGDGGSDDAQETLTVVGWGGSAQTAHEEAIYRPWAEANDVELRTDQPTDYAKLRAQVDSGKVSWGVTQVEPNFAVNACDDGLLEKIDTDVVDTSVINPDFVSECSIPLFQYAFTIAYNTDTFSDAHPTTWEEFFDTEMFPGKRGFWDSASGGIFEAALLADGVAPEELYPLDLDRAFVKLDSVKDDLIFYGTGDEQVQLLASGEAPLVQAWNGRVFDAAEQGEPVANEWNEHFLSHDNIAIPAGYPNADLAQQFMGDFVNDLEAQAANTEASSYAPVNDEALDLVDEDVVKEMPTYPDNAEKAATNIDYGYWAENYDEVTERFNEWKLQ